MIKANALVLVGAVAGAYVGYLAVGWLSSQGYYGIILPGGLLGLGAGIFMSRSRVMPIVCGVLAVAAGLYTEWRFFPFVADGSLGYFASHVSHLRPPTLIFIGLGAAIAVYVPYRRSQDARRAMSRAES